MKKITFLLLLLVGSLFCWAVESKQPETDDAIQADKYQEYSEAFKRIDSAKLPDLIEEIEEKRSETEQAKAFFEQNKNIASHPLPFGNAVSEIVAVSIPFVMIIAVVGFVLYFRYKRKKELYALMAKFLEAGKEVPIELLKEPKEVSSDLKKGLIGVALGIAGVTGGFMINMKLVWISLIPLFVGLAYILSHFLLKKKDETSGN